MIISEVDRDNILLRKREFAIQVQQKEIKINQEQYDMSSFDFKKENFERLVDFFCEKKAINKYFFVNDFASDEDIVVLLALTFCGNKFYYNDDLYELSFAYAVPLNRDTYLMEFAVQYLEECLKTHNIVFLKSDTLYLCEKVTKIGYDKVCKKNRKTVRNNAQILIEQIPFSSEFFDFWEEYDYTRFGERQSKEFKEFFWKLYSSSPTFQLYRYSQNGEAFAYNVLYFSQNQKVIYDVLFPWENANSVYRIGIFSIIKNLQMAVESGWGYSICYGKFEYKDQIWKYL